MIILVQLCYSRFPFSASTINVSVESPTKQSIRASGDKDEHYINTLVNYYLSDVVQDNNYIGSKR